MGFISRYVREQKRYTKNEIKSIFSFSESEAESFIRRLKSFGIMKAVRILRDRGTFRICRTPISK